MCGIAGFFQVKPVTPNDRAVLDAMVDALTPRGPDDRGVRVDGRCGMGMRRLAVIDPVSGSQPMVSGDGSLVLVFNGEMYNYREERVLLEKKGYTFRTGSDTEVLLNCFAAYGDETLSRVNGMFALALYNRTTRRLLLARDRLGIKPLYWRHGPDGCVFASELKALFRHPRLPRQISSAALDCYLTLECVPAPLTILDGVYKLEPGSLLSFDGTHVTVRRWYTPTFAPKLPAASEEEHIRQLDTRIGRAVEKRLISDVPLGIFLSGGIDSSLIAWYAAESQSRPISTFTVAFTDESFDESAHARRVAACIHSDHHEMVFTEQNLLDTLPAALAYMDEPFADPSLLPTALLAAFARKSVTVALSGDGGDELFGGYPTYLARKITGWLPAWLIRSLLWPGTLLPPSSRNISLDFKIKKMFAPLRENADIRHLYWMGAFDRRLKERLYRSERLRNRSGALGALVEGHMASCDTEQNWERSLWLDNRFYLQDDMLVKADRAGMMHSLEVRVPLLDHTVVDYARRLPASLKYRGVTSKYLLKKLARTRLPAAIVRRPKKGFGIPLASWLRGPLRETAHDLLAPRTLREQGVFDERYVLRICDEHMNGARDHRKLLWTLMMFQHWRREYRCAVS